MQELQAFLQQYINAPINILYGHVGAQIQTILIVQNNQITPIGQFVYMFRQDWKNPIYKPYFELLAKRAELYRTGQLEKIPYMCYHNDHVAVDEIFINTF